MGISKFWIIVTCLIISGSVAGQEKFNLEYKYVKGKTYKYLQEIKYESVQEINGQEMKGKGTTSSVLKMTVEDVAPNGDIRFVNSLEEFRITTNMMGMDTTMEMKDMLDKRIRTVISRYGKLIRQDVIDTVESGGLLAEKGSGLSTAYKEFIVFPDTSMKFGDTWNDKRTDTTKGTEMVTSTDLMFTLQGFEYRNGRNCVKANFTGKTDINGKMKQMGMEFFMEGTGQTTGTLWFDAESGIVVSNESTIDQEMTMALTGQMQMTIPITSLTTTKFTLLE